MTTLFLFPTNLIAQPKEAGKSLIAYWKFREAVSQAKELDNLLPLISKDFVQLLANQTKEKRNAWLIKIRESQKKSEVEVKQEAVDGDKSTLTLTGKDPTGKLLQGTVQMIKEDSTWKFDEEVWTESAPEAADNKS